MNIVDRINEAKTATEVIELQIEVQQSMLSSTDKRPLLRLLDAQLALAKAREELGEAFVEFSEVKEGDL